MLLTEILSEEFVSQSQRGKFYACASGKGYDCGDESKSKWKRMTKEFEDSTPKGKKLPKHVDNSMCSCNKCMNMAKNDSISIFDKNDGEGLDPGPDMTPDERRKFELRDKRLTKHNELTRKKAVNAVPLSTMKKLKKMTDEGAFGGGEDESEDISLGQQALAIIDGITGTGKSSRDLRRSDFKQKFAQLRDIVAQWLANEKGEDQLPV